MSYDELRITLRKAYDNEVKLPDNTPNREAITEWGFEIYIKGYLAACALKGQDPALPISEAI